MSETYRIVVVKEVEYTTTVEAESEEEAEAKGLDAISYDPNRHFVMTLDTVSVCVELEEER